MTYSEACDILSGPIPTLRTPYDHHGNIDYNALYTCIDFDLHTKTNVIVLTAGDSHLEAMSDVEIANLTQNVVKHVNKRATVVAADRSFDTKQALAFAKTCRQWGVDMLMVKPPDWAQSTTPETLAQHYAQIAKEIPVMLVTNIFMRKDISFGLETIQRALDLSNQIVAIKDDIGGDFAQQMTIQAHQQCAIWAGGQKKNHHHIAPHGAHGYLSTFLTFKPDIAHQYWHAYQTHNTSEITRIIEDIDKPFFDFIISNFTGGFDAALHGILEIFNLAKRWRPKPYHSLTDAEMDTLKNFLIKRNII